MSNAGTTISLELRDLRKNFGAFEALRGIDLTVAAGEFIVIVGPSGCGKSTLLKAIAGLEDLSSGEIHIHGRDVTHEEPGSRGIAMVFQSYALYPHMTVAENMGFGLRMARRPRAEIDAAVTRAAKILRITDQLDKRPRQLSGGQRQRVAIGRAITRSPEVFLFDEPLSNLDAALRMQMRVELGTLHAELGATMVYVTHDQIEAMTMASRIVVLNAGRIEQVGSPLELYTNPGNLFVAGFLGAPRMNFIDAKVMSIDGTRVLVAAPGLQPVELALAAGTSLALNSPVTLGIRPEHVKVGKQHFSVPAKVRLVERLGRETFLYVDASPLITKGSDTGRADITVHIAETASFAQGQSLVLSFDPRDALLFGPDGQRLTPAKRLASS